MLNIYEAFERIDYLKMNYQNLAVVTNNEGTGIARAISIKVLKVFTTDSQKWKEEIKLLNNQDWNDLPCVFCFS